MLQLRMGYGRAAARKFALTSAIAAPVMAAGFSAFAANTLQDAVAEALATNASLKAEEQIVNTAASARDLSAAEFRPTIQGYGQWGTQRLELNPVGQSDALNSNLDPRGYGIQLNQNIWNGFKTVRSVSRDEKNLASARASLENYSQQLVLDVVTAYTNVMRDRAVLAQFEANVDALALRMREMRSRKAAGLALDTDREQAQSYLSKAEADKLAAQANLQTSIARYRLVVGSEPGKLTRPRVPTALLPQSLDAAIHTARNEHPGIAAAEAAADASDDDIGVARAGYMPSLDLQATAENNYDPLNSLNIDQQKGYSAMVRMTVPVWTGGRVDAQVDMSVYKAAEKKLRLDYEREAVTSQVISTWGQYQSANRIVEAARKQASSARLALKGIESGEAAGLRLSTEYYEARRAFIEAEVGVASAERDQVVAAYALLNAIGRLNEGAPTGPVIAEASPWMTETRDALGWLTDLVRY